MVQREHRKIGFFIKVCRTEQHAQDFLDGSLFCNRVCNFRKLGGDNGGDSYEGGIPDPKGRGVYICPWIEHLNVFCLYAGHAATSIDDISTLEQQLKPPLNLEYEFGKHAILVYDAPEFLSRMRKTILDSYLMFQAGVVQYYDVRDSESWFGVKLPDSYANGEPNKPLELQLDHVPIGVRPLMSKRIKFGHQREYRFILDTATKSDTPYILTIQDGIRDIAKLTSIAEIRRTFQVRLRQDHE